MDAEAMAVERSGSRVAPAVPDIVREHLEELGFLSIQRRKLLFSGEISRRDLSSHDARIEAHWDGLVVGMPVSVELARERLGDDDEWDVYAAVRVWLELGRPSRDELLEVAGAVEEPQRGAWREALRRSNPTVLHELFPDGPVGESGSGLLATTVYACGWHGALGEARLVELASHEAAEVRYAAARAIGWLEAPSSRALQALASTGNDTDDAVRRAGLWSQALIDAPRVVARCRERISSGDADPFELWVVGLLGQLADAPLLESALQSEASREAAARALGNLGAVRAVNPLIGLLEHEQPTTVSAAADAIRTLLGGVPLPDEDDEGRADATAFREHWAAAAAEFDPGCRWLRGRRFPWDGPAEEEPMEWVWRGALLAPDTDTARLRREAPDGFFRAELDPAAVPGE